MISEILSEPEPTADEVTESLEIAVARLAAAEDIFRHVLKFSEEADAGYVEHANYCPKALAARRRDLRRAISLTQALIAEFTGTSNARSDVH